MSSKKRKTPARDRRLFVRSERREAPDLGKLSRALIALALAQAQAEADAQAEHRAKPDNHEGPRAG
jgi:hypothetical protein